MSRKSATATETAPLLSSSNRQENASPETAIFNPNGQATPVQTTQDNNDGTQQIGLESKSQRVLISVFVANLLVWLAHYLAISSIMDLIRGLSCQERYLQQPNSPSGPQLDCSLVDIQDRTSMVFSYMLSINSFISCLSALWLAPWLLRHLGRRGTMTIAVLAPTAELFVLASIPNVFSTTSTGGWIDSPTAALRFLLVESLLFGIVGCPDTLIGIVSQTIVLESAPSALRSTWLARLSSCTFLGMLASTFILNSLSLDTSSDSVSDKFPILLGALVSTVALMWTLLTLPAHLQHSATEASSRSRHDLQSEEQSKGMVARIRVALEPLRLLLPIEVENQAELHAHQGSRPKRKRDWRLTKLIIAVTLCDQIAVTTNLQVIYVQTRFGLHAQELSQILGMVGLIKWVYLVVVFPRIADAVRQRYRSGATRADGGTAELLSATAAADRLLAVLSMSIDVLAWAVVIVGGRTLDYPTYLLGLIFYALAGANVSSITSLASILLPKQVSTDSLVATLSSLANLMSTIGPIANANIYRFGLARGMPEIVFASAAAISLVTAALVASTSPAVRRNTTHAGR